MFLRVTNHTGQVEKNLLGPAGIRTRDLRFTSPSSLSHNNHLNRKSRRHNRSSCTEDELTAYKQRIEVSHESQKLWPTKLSMTTQINDQSSSQPPVLNITENNQFPTSIVDTVESNEVTEHALTLEYLANVDKLQY